MISQIENKILIFEKTKIEPVSSLLFHNCVVKINYLVISGGVLENVR
jgi:hypothetical protein